MKKVGILTVHHYHNYGSALQAFATQRLFEKLGYNATIIDYKSPEIIYATEKCMDYDLPEDFYLKSLERRKKWKNPIKKIIITILEITGISNMLYSAFGIVLGTDLYKKWVKHFKLTRKYTNIHELYSNPPQFDIYVIGGDQLWNTHITYNNPVYFLSFVNNDAKKITFSTSIGIPFIPERELSNFKKGLRNFSSILLREQEAVDYVHSLGFEADVVLDPTLLLTGAEWESVANIKYRIPYTKYILAYFLDPSDWTSNLLETVRKDVSLPVIYIGGTKKKYAWGYYTGPIEVSTFISLFANAEIVVTNSFHGMAFTLVFNKVLITTYRSKESTQSMNSRHRNMIDMFDLYSCIYHEDSFSEKKISYMMDYEKINKILKEQREKTFLLLENALK